MKDYIEETMEYAERFYIFFNQTDKKELVYKELESYPISIIAKLHLAAGFGENIRSK